MVVLYRDLSLAQLSPSLLYFLLIATGHALTLLLLLNDSSRGHILKKLCECWPLGRTILLRIKRLCLEITLTSGNTSELYWSLLTLTSWKTNMTPPYLSIYHTIFTDYILIHAYCHNPVQYRVEQC